MLLLPTAATPLYEARSFFGIWLRGPEHDTNGCTPNLLLLLMLMMVMLQERHIIGINTSTWCSRVLAPMP
jgi:hypothetical protein